MKLPRKVLRVLVYTFRYGHSMISPDSGRMPRSFGYIVILLKCVEFVYVIMSVLEDALIDEFRCNTKLYN